MNRKELISLLDKLQRYNLGVVPVMLFCEKQIDEGKDYLHYLGLLNRMGDEVLDNRYYMSEALSCMSIGLEQEDLEVLLLNTKGVEELHSLRKFIETVLSSVNCETACGNKMYDTYMQLVRVLINGKFEHDSIDVITRFASSKHEMRAKELEELVNTCLNLHIYDNQILKWMYKYYVTKGRYNFFYMLKSESFREMFTLSYLNNFSTIEEYQLDILFYLRNTID